MRLAEALFAAPPRHTRAVAERLGLAATAGAAEIAAALLDRERLAALVAELGERTRGIATAAVLTRDGLAARTWGAPPDAATFELELCGLAFAHDRRPYRSWVVPADLRDPLARALAARHAQALKRGRAARWIAAPVQAAHDAAALSAHIHRTPPRVKIDGELYSRTWPKLHAALPPLEGGIDAFDDDRVLVALDLLRLGGFVRLRVDDRPGHEQRRELVAASGLAGALATDRAALRARLEQAALANHTAARCAAALVDELGGRTVSLASFGRALLSLYEEAGVRADPSAQPAAHALHGLAPLWLTDAIELGLDGEGRALALRPPTAEAPGATSPPAVCQSNFELVLMHPPSPAQRLALELACEAVEGQAHVYRITRESVRSAAAAIAAGILPPPASAEGDGRLVVAAVVGELAGELPQNVERSISDWTPTVRPPLRLRTAMVVDAGDEATADELAGGALDGLVRERLGTTLLAISADRIDEVGAALETAGHELEPGIDRISGRWSDRDAYHDPSTRAEDAWLPDAEDETPADLGELVSTLDRPPPPPAPPPAARPARPSATTGAANAIAVVLEALEEELDVAIVYAGARGITERVISPYELNGAAVRAWCHLRDDERSFWLSSIRAAELIED